MNLTCQLKGTYEDIRLIRRIKGWSQQQLADALGKKPSYVSELENGKVNLTLTDYQWILTLLECSVQMKMTISTEKIKTQLKNKGAMYVKHSNRELAKQFILNHLETAKEEWCVEGLAVATRLLEILDQKAVQVQIKNPDYAVYDGTDGGNYELLSSVFHLDIDKFATQVVENSEEVLEKWWSFPTQEGPYLDFYHLLTVEEAHYYDQL